MLKFPKLKKFEIYAAIISLSYMLFFIFWFIFNKNNEFSFYAFGIVLLFAFFFLNIRKMDLSPFVLWGFVVLGFLHLFGGALYIFGVRLYDLMSFNLIDLGGEFVLVKYDQIIHFFSTFFTFLGLNQIYNKYSKDNLPSNNKNSFKTIYFLLFFASFGISCTNEIIEFFPAYFWLDNGVGGYINTILDLFANFFGSFFGFLWVLIFSKKN